MKVRLAIEEVKEEAEELRTSRVTIDEGNARPISVFEGAVENATVRDDDLRRESFKELKRDWLLRFEKKILQISSEEGERVDEKDVEEPDNDDIAKDELEMDCYFSGSKLNFDPTFALGATVQLLPLPYEPK